MALDSEKGSRVHDEEHEEEDLREILKTLKLDFEKLSGAIDFNSANARKLAFLVNARQRIAVSIFAGTSLLRNPRLRLATDSGRRIDLARMLQRASIKNNPASQKLVSEAEAQKDGESC